MPCNTLFRFLGRRKVFQAATLATRVPVFTSRLSLRVFSTSSEPSNHTHAAASCCEPPVRVRYAPSPTGSLHLGGLRTALYNYLLAKQQGGKFLLRIEDTDQTRLVPGSVEQLVDSLHWAGVPFDEGPGKEGDCGPYVQSQRLPIYHEHVNRLLASGHAYRCFCTAERLTQLKNLQVKRGIQSTYDRFCSHLTPEEVQERMREGPDKWPFTVRLRVPDSADIVFRDELRGEIRVQSRSVDDQVLLKSDGFPTYHLASVVDDHLMRISHVIRGEEWLPSTPKHILLYQCFDWSPPRFFHLPLLLDNTRHKLSKRHGDASVESYRERGYLPSAVVNFVALLGWHDDNDREVYLSQADLVKAFCLTRVQKGGAVVDAKRLDWINSQHIRHLADTDLRQLIALIRPHVERTHPSLTIDDAYLTRVVSVLKERASTIPQFAEYSFFFFAEPDYKSEAGKQARASLWVEQNQESLSAVRAVMTELESTPESTFALSTELHAVFERVVHERKGSYKTVMNALRFALTGSKVGMGMSETVSLLGKEKVVSRLAMFLEEEQWAIR